MNEEKTNIVKADMKLPRMIEDAYDSIEKMNQFANLLLESKLVPDHFYEKGADRKTDYSKGRTAAVAVVLLQAQQLNLSPLTALQHIIPVQGLLSLKGDLARTMIFSSGKLKKGSWKEESTGTIEDENMVVTITATREDNGITISRSFSVETAKRAGLWVTPQMLSGTEGWKWKSSAWFKYPQRMLFYRALGHLARDLFSDVLNNMYTTEEAVDLPQDTTVVIETPSGAEITIPDKDFNKERSQNLTSRTVEKIDKKNGITDVHEEKEDPAPPQRLYTMEEMTTMLPNALLKICDSDPLMRRALEVVPGKNTNRKLREIIDYFQKGKLEKFLQEHDKPKEPEKKPEPVSDDIPMEPQLQLEPEPEDETPADNTDLQPDDSFSDTPPPETETGNTPEDTPEDTPFEFEVSELPESGLRDFKELSVLYGGLQEITPPVTDKRFTELSKLNEVFDRFESKEDFCRKGSVEEFNILLKLNAETK